MALVQVDSEQSVGTPPTDVVAITSLLPSDSPRLAGVNVEHAHSLAECEESLPPIVVHRSTMRVIDGMHRLHAAVLRGEDAIKIHYFDGDENDAFLQAVAANVTHGLPLSRIERAMAAERIVCTHPQWSDRAIASVTGLSGKTVGSIRRRAAGEDSQPDTRVGRDGRSRPLNSTEGRRIARELIEADPKASLRKIAAAAGISPGTVRDVRQHLYRDENPVPPGQRPGMPARDHIAILQKLKKDPSLRFTERGRVLLRLLDTLSVRKDEWQRLGDDVPPHCASLVEELARACATAWQELAEHLNRR